MINLSSTSNVIKKQKKIKKNKCINNKNIELDSNSNSNPSEFNFDSINSNPKSVNKFNSFSKTIEMDELDNEDEYDEYANIINIINLEKDSNIISQEIKLSEEQSNIINSRTNIIVDAVAGSGKTTTILHMGLKYPDKNIYQITYNNMLKREVRKKIINMGIKNMHIHTYHSLAVGYYDSNAFTDEEIKKIIIKNKKIKSDVEIKPIDIIFIDESQDMMFDYYYLIKKFIIDTKSQPQIIVLGDKYQGIYDFKGADIKFLTLADKIWNVRISNSNNIFCRLNLTQSYRLTNQIGWFVNNIMLGNNYIQTNKPGPIIDYYIANSFEIYKKIGKYILEIIEKDKILPSDIFILVPSLKSSVSPYKKLENFLVKHGIKCSTPTSDDAKLDEKVISNKVVFTTYHQSKGRERKVVILYNFDDSFTEYYLKNTNGKTTGTNGCPNILYVGVTRASYKLILIQDFRYKPLEFLNLNKLKTNSYLNVINLHKPNINKNNFTKPNQEIKKLSVSDLVKFISSTTIEYLLELIENLFELVSVPVKQIDIPNKIKIETPNNKIIWEDVSDLNGLVIPALYESKINKKKSTIELYIEEKIQNKEVSTDLMKYSGKIHIPAKNITDYLKIGNVYLTLQNNLHAKLAQIKKYNWLNDKIVKDCHDFMNMIDSNTQFEIPISNVNLDHLEFIHESYGLVHIKGRLDAISNTDVWEFKCVDNLTMEHKLQLIIYYWMWDKANYDDIYGKKNFRLLNIKSGHTLKLNLSTQNKYIIGEIIELLLNEKCSTKKYICDKEFIKLCNKY